MSNNRLSPQITPRITPLDPPYEPATEAAFARIMPPGREPLKLFRTMAHSPRVLQRMFAGGLLDKGSVELRDRELIILRTCARCNSEYEWGVHVAMFARRAGLSEQQVAATRAVDPDCAGLGSRDALLFRLVDGLHDEADVSDEVWNGLAAHFNAEQLLELIALTGYYHTISFMTNAIRIDLEPDAARFP
jgi:alkylhydroperoxidase family enzyme